MLLTFLFSATVLMFTCSLGTLLAFSVLRPKNKVVYMPRFKYSAEDKRPPRLDDGLFAWLKPLSKTTETELLNQIGLDAVVFLRFLRMCRWMCSLLAMLACALLIPCDVAYNLKYKPSDLATSSNTLAMMSITNLSGSYVHLFLFPFFDSLLYGLVNLLPFSNASCALLQVALCSRRLWLSRHLYGTLRHLCQLQNRGSLAVAVVSKS